MSLSGVAAENRALAGIGWMVLAGLFFVGMTGMVRYLGSDVAVMQAAFLRYLFGFLMILPMLRPRSARRPEARVVRLHVFRGLVHGGAVILWFYAMARIPIAEVTAIGYIAPIFVTIGAAMFLGERLHARRIGAVIVGFIGTVIILRPGFEAISLGQLAQLAAAPLFAVSFLLAKRLTDTEDPATIVAILSLACTLILLPGALYQWQPLTWEQVLALALTAAFATAGHYALTRAYRAAPISVTQPVGFLQLVWAGALGMLVFGEPLDPFVFLGGGIIIAAAAYISHREAIAARQPQTPPPGATKV